MLVDGGEAIASIHTRTTAHTHSQIHKHRQTHAGARAHAPSLQIMVHSRKFRFGADSGDTKMLHIVRTANICGITNGMGSVLDKNIPRSQGQQDVLMLLQQRALATRKRAASKTVHRGLAFYLVCVTSGSKSNGIKDQHQQLQMSAMPHRDQWGT